MSEQKYDFANIESKWQSCWAAKPYTPAQDAENYYVLEMFPYPSGKIHMGHLRNYSIGDAIARYKMLEGYNVLHPMGWDGFGLPAENAAIERNVNPADWTYANIDAMREEFKSIGFAFNWDKEFATCDPDYFKHEQGFFIDMLAKDIAYQKEAEVNWDPVDQTVLANEQVVDGKGWRSGALVERKKLKQWFLAVSNYSEDLLASLDSLEQWPEAVKSMQRRWIGKSQGASIFFEIQDSNKKLEVFTTRPDTIFGASFCGIAAGHELATELAIANPKIAAFIEQCKQSSTAEADIEKNEKLGFDTGLKVKHPFIEGKTLPIYIANFILMDYGTGAIFGCPAHDERDLEFAKKYDLEILQVVNDSGELENSEFLNGQKIEEAKKTAIARLEQDNLGKGKTTFRLRDWGVSRQRYWGCPIPIIYCDSCGTVPVEKQNLPVTLPKDVEFTGNGNPLALHPTWKHTSCPKCNAKAVRETDTFDTFFESSWYFAKFANENKDEGINKQDASKWLPIDSYIGGIEHAVMHLLYSRFYMRALEDCGIIEGINEPIKKLITQGMVCHPTYKDQDGKWLYPEEIEKSADAKGFITKATKQPVTLGRSEKMSKSKRNTISSKEIMTEYGADTARMFMLSDSPTERDLEWSDSGLEGCYKYLNRLYLQVNSNANIATEEYSQNKDVRAAIHKTIKLIQDSYKRDEFNKAIAAIRTLNNVINDLENDKLAIAEGLSAVVYYLFPITPHIAEEMWQILGHKQTILNSVMPKIDANLLAVERSSIVVQVNGKKKAIITVSKTEAEDAVKALAEEQISGSLEGKQIRKTIYVPNRIVNFVVA